MNTIETWLAKSARLKTHMLKHERRLQMHRSKLNAALLLTAVGLLFAGCVHKGAMDTTGQARGKTYRQISCASWKPIEYDSEKDTPLTVNGVRVHNQTGRNLRCWK